MSLPAHKKRKRRDLLYLRQQGKCYYCARAMVLPQSGVGAHAGMPANLATIEHLVPLRDGGTNSIANMALACRTCNQERGRLIERLILVLEREVES